MKKDGDFCAVLFCMERSPQSSSLRHDGAARRDGGRGGEPGRGCYTGNIRRDRDRSESVWRYRCLSKHDERWHLCHVSRYASGQLQTAEGETTEAAFAQITEENLEYYITRPHLRVRLLDARNSRCVPYEAFRVRPYDLIRRLEE